MALSGISFVRNCKKIGQVFQNLLVREMDNIFYNKLHNNIKEIDNNSQFKKELKDVLIKG
jgi:hypothetical protein